MDARTAHACKDEKKEHIRTNEEKSKVDKKDNITIVLFFFSIFLIILFGLSP
jgi:hypothetical protein